MQKERTIEPKKIWQKLLIYWHTKNYTKQTYDIALIIAAAIYTDRKIYEEELLQAKRMLQGHLNHEASVQKVMDYIELKLSRYVEDEELWYQDLQTCRTFIQKNEELYIYFIDIFEADENLDEEEIAFETSLRKTLLRS